jgi:hypothetical protein
MRPYVSFAAMRQMIPIVGMLLAVGAGSAYAQPRPMPPERMPPERMPPERMPPPQPAWDSRGWVSLGERTVNGRVDRDRIEVGRYEGKFNKLMLVVENSDLELIDFKIVFGDRTEYSPRLQHFFREGQRTRAIDLPPSEQVIRHIEFQYRNLRGGGEARVQVWGWRVGGAAAPPPAAPPPAAPPPARRSWDTRGWTMLGQRQIDGRVDRDRIEVGRNEGRFSKLTMAVEDSDLELIDFRIEFADRTEYRPKLSHVFREGQRTRVIDLPPSEQVIRFIDIQYRNTRGGGPASVEVWGLRVGSAGPPPTHPPAWDPKGWTLLGERTVSGRMDRDRIAVGRHEGRFTRLMMVVEDSDLELIGFVVHFGRGAPFRPAVTHFFREGQRTRAIDLPGDDRIIRHIDLRYRNTPGGGRAKVMIYGLPERPVWDNQGWTMLGEQRVTGRGREDTDRIRVSRWEGKFRRLTLVVLDSDIELNELAIKFGRGEPFRPQIDGVFRENSRTRVIDLPGDDRAIRWIEFRYRNLPGGGSARVQVWAK